MATISEALAIALQHHQAGQLPQAEQIYRQILEVEPNHADAWHLLGVLAHQVGQHAVAIEFIRRAIELNDQDASYFCNVGQAHLAIRNHIEACSAFSRAIELCPQLATAHCNLGNAYQQQGRFAAALECYHKARDLEPTSAMIECNLGAALKCLGKTEQAIECHRRAIAIDPSYTSAYVNLGVALCDQGKLDDSETCFRKALVLSPDNLAAICNLGGALKCQGRVNEAIECYMKVLAVQPEYPLAVDGLVFALPYLPDTPLSSLSKPQPSVGEEVARPVSQFPVINRDEDRILRLGFVSPDLGMHPVGFLMQSVLRHVDRRQYEIACYSTRVVNDDITTGLRNLSDFWHEVVTYTDEDLAEQVRRDKVDILIDLAGHTTNNRLSAFQLRPAPIQASWLGGVGPSQSPTINYFITDHITVSDELLGCYREKVIRLPTIWCSTPPDNAPEVRLLPAMLNGHVTFGSFNNLAKINPLVVQTWARILKQLPTSRLVMKYRGLDSPSVTERYRALFAAERIDSSRIELQGESPFAEMLEMYNSHVDIALDPFPFNGGMTTMLALYMGVPVITCPGETVASRQSLAILTALGMPETVACDLDEYVDIAVALANDLPRLAELRRGLRQRCLESPLYDGPKFARDLMDNLRQVWREWVAKNPV